MGVIERAFTLAQSGRYAQLQDLYKALRKEGFTHLDLTELQLPSIAKQLRGERLRAVQQKSAPAVQADMVSG
ncbi:MAG TPA: hypothetical protein VGB60_00625 [Brevundimonas sp.]|jgi:hypothetical protein|uniref:hypothetical protein n=1 Tax=Brevundimonas sp. TaxID=1871086 RepID=UPI002ED84C1E